MILTNRISFAFASLTIPVNSETKGRGLQMYPVSYIPLTRCYIISPEPIQCLLEKNESLAKIKKPLARTKQEPPHFWTHTRPEGDPPGPAPLIRRYVFEPKCWTRVRDAQIATGTRPSPGATFGANSDGARSSGAVRR
jgi:hypothetical protein